MGFWKYGVVGKELSRSVIRRFMSLATKDVEKQPIELTTGQKFFIASATLNILTYVVTKSVLAHRSYAYDREYYEWAKNLNNESSSNGYDGDKAVKKH